MVMKSDKFKRICVVGLGYVGLPTAAILASRGYVVHGVDVDPRAAESINSGRAHIVEPDLDLLVQAAVQIGRLSANPEPTEADVFLLCVPTPLRDGHKPDISYVRAATESICRHVRDGNLVVLESTSPPGTTEEVAKILASNPLSAGVRVHVAHAPERVLPGKVIREVVENDRVVGGVDAPSTQLCHDFYATFVSGRIHSTSARMAETVKLVENAFRDVNIAFANELSMLCEELRLDVWELIALANRHPRVNILSPGAGVGGHCIAVDPWFLVDAAPAASTLIRTARGVNDTKPNWIVERILRRASRFKKPTIACLGLAYKPDIDDLRESPAVEIVTHLMQRTDVEVRVVEPNLESHPKFQLSELNAAVEAADIIVILVAHQQFRLLRPADLAEKIVFDPAGLLQKQAD